MDVPDCGNFFANAFGNVFTGDIWLDTNGDLDADIHAIPFPKQPKRQQFTSTDYMELARQQYRNEFFEKHQPMNVFVMTIDGQPLPSTEPATKPKPQELDPKTNTETKEPAKTNTETKEPTKTNTETKEPTKTTIPVPQAAPISGQGTTWGGKYIPGVLNPNTSYCGYNDAFDYKEMGQTKIFERGTPLERARINSMMESDSEIDKHPRYVFIRIDAWGWVIDNTFPGDANEVITAIVDAIIATPTATCKFVLRDLGPDYEWASRWCVSTSDSNVTKYKVFPVKLMTQFNTGPKVNPRLVRLTTDDDDKLQEYKPAFNDRDGNLTDCYTGHKGKESFSCSPNPADNPEVAINKPNADKERTTAAWSLKLMLTLNNFGGGEILNREVIESVHPIIKGLTIDSMHTVTWRGRQIMLNHDHIYQWVDKETNQFITVQLTKQKTVQQ